MRYRAYWAWLALAGLWACSALITAQEPKQQKFRLSVEQMEAIKAGKTATAWVDTTLWVSVDGGTPLNHAHPCPPFDDC